MERHWGEAMYLLKVLTWRSLGYDSDGMELYFTDPDTKFSVKPGKNQSVGDFVRAMDEARPKRRASKTDVKTDVYPKLQEIMLHYIQMRTSSVREKPKTVIILTDGVWEGMPREDDLDSWMEQNLYRVADQLRKDILDQPNQGMMTWQELLEKSRPITFEFVFFGWDPNGARRMVRLDEIGKRGLP
jgi:hypothetical protein